MTLQDLANVAWLALQEDFLFGFDGEFVAIIDDRIARARGGPQP